MALTDKYVTNAGAGTADGSSLANALSWPSMVTAINAGGAAGNRYNVNGAISRAASDTISGSGTATSPIVIRGYSSVIGDGYQGRTNGNGALVTTNMPAVTYGSTFVLNLTGSWVILEALNCAGNVNGNFLRLGATSVARGCVFNNASTGAAAAASTQNGANSVAIDCDLTLSGASGGLVCVILSVSGTKTIGCRIKGGTAAGVQISSSAILSNNTIIGGVGIGVAMNSTAGLPQITNNTIVGFTSDGINIITGTTGLQTVFGNLITDNGGYGINGVSAANAIMAAYNRLDRNTSGATNLATDWLAATSYGHNTTSVLQAAEYTAAGSNDYRLLNGSPAAGNGLPAYADIGALQRQATGGGTTLLNRGILTGGRLY